MSVKEKKIKIEGTFHEWCEMIRAFDNCCDMLMMFRKLVKANIEAKGAKELHAKLPEMIMQLQEQMSFLKENIAEGLSVSDVRDLASEEIAKAKASDN